MITEKEIDKKIKNIILSKKEIYIKQDEHKISDKKADEELVKLENIYQDLVKQKIQILNKKIEHRATIVKEKQKEVIIKVKTILKPLHKNIIKSTESNNKLILKFLMQPKIDNEDKLVAVIKELKPEIEENNIRRQIRNTISEIKNKDNKKFINYDFDNKNYTVKELCQQKLF